MSDERGQEPAYERITFCLLDLPRHPIQLIKDRRTTAYNVGQTMELRDFDAGRVTVLRATALLGMIVVYLGALGAVFRWFGDDFKAFRAAGSLAVLAAHRPSALFISAFSVGPKIWVRYRRKRRERLALGADTTVPSAGYFRLDPYTADQPESFNRADGAHERVLRWLRATPRPVLFLSGASGTGKSSLLEAYVLPSLEREGWRVELVRSFADPLKGLEAALGGRRGARRRCSSSSSTSSRSS